MLTRHGTVVGPVMHDLTGHPELTPHKGGWCGNDIFPEALSPEHRERRPRAHPQLGDRLAKEGYRGFFEVDYLVDLDTGELYLGELNPRISGVTSMTNVTAGAYADMPLFLFHLLEYLDVDYEIDVAEINERWARRRARRVEPARRQADRRRGRAHQRRAAHRDLAARRRRRGRVPALGQRLARLQDESEAFYLRVLGPGDYRYKGADLGVIVTRSRLQADDGQLTERARHWITEMKASTRARRSSKRSDPDRLPRRRQGV